MRPVAEELLSGAHERRGELVDLLLSLASIDAPSGGGTAALGPAADEVARALETVRGRATRVLRDRQGLVVRRYPQPA